jgi:hypothetical protein
MFVVDVDCQPIGTAFANLVICHVLLLQLVVSDKQSLPFLTYPA